MSEWRMIRGDVEVSDCGQVRRAGRVLSQFKTGKSRGYLTVYIDGKNVKVHRLVAEAFFPPPLAAQTQVNHKDGNPHNNRAENLEWCTPSENVRHAFRVLGRKSCGGHSGKTGALHHMSRSIRAIRGGETVGVFGSAAEAARQLGLQSSSVIRAANGVYAQTGGYLFDWQ